jgi:cysteine desulfurase
MSFLSKLLGTNKRRVHLDYASTTPIDRVVFAEMSQVSRCTSANPGSLHSSGKKAQGVIQAYRAEMRELLGTDVHDIVFVRGGTEACNIALQQALRLWGDVNPGIRPHVIISPVEHAAIRELCMHLASEGLIELTLTQVSTSGAADVHTLISLFRPNTAVVSVQLVNNEIGIVHPVKKITHAIRRYKMHRNTKSMFPLVVCDAIQAGETLDIRPQSLGVDYLTLSSSKFYGPKSGGVVCVPRNQHRNPGVLWGGAQESSMRPGTEDSMLIAGTVSAYRIACRSRQQHVRSIVSIRNYCIQMISERFPMIIINSSPDDVPHIVHISLPHMDSDYAVLFFDHHGIEVASQSACSAHTGGVSHVVRTLWSARDIPSPELYAHIRFSFGRTTCKADIDAMLQVLAQLMQQRYVRA